MPIFAPYSRAVVGSPKNNRVNFLGYGMHPQIMGHNLQSIKNRQWDTTRKSREGLSLYELSKPFNKIQAMLHSLHKIRHRYRILTTANIGVLCKPIEIN